MRRGLAEIRGFLVKGESAEGWLGICGVLEEADVSEREMWVGYVSQHTKGWAKSIRRPLYGWWERKQRGEVTGYEGLVSDWSMYVWGEGRVAGEVRMVPFAEGMRMRWIPAGTFWMGSGDDDEEASDDEKPQREVTITRGFWMMETPVTQGQYQTVMGHNPSHFVEAGLRAPVEGVSWYDAAAFANKLSALEGVSACFVGESFEMEGIGNKGSDYIKCRGWRLPTQAEWEYACRAGTTTPRYGDLIQIAWYDARSPFSVGVLHENAWGLHDTLGNVWEWCYDGFENSARTDLALVDLVEIEDSSLRMKRGGSWDFDEPWLRAASACFNKPIYRNDNTGFRLVRSGS